MKKIYLIVAVLVSGFTSNAQRVEKSFNVKSTDGAATTEHGSHGQNQTEKIVIWDNDFSASSDWTISNNTADAQDWVITTLSSTATGYGRGTWLEPINPVSNENGYALFDSDLVGVDGGFQDASITLISGGANLTGYPNVVLTFAQRVTMWTTTETTVLVSIDGGTVWQPYPVNVGMSTSTTVEDMVSVNISAFAGGAANVLVKFNYIGSWDYAWMVDDVAIIEQPNNDIQNVYAYIVGVNNLGVEYGRTPLNQIDSEYEVGGSVTNFGVNTQTNVVATADFVSFSANYPLGSVNNGDTVNYFSTEAPALAVGIYNGTYTVVSTEETGGVEFGNNTSLRSFEITNNYYSVDGIGIHPASELVLGSMGSESFGAPAETYLANFYSLKGATNTVNGFQIGLTSSTVAGSELQIQIVDTANFFADDVIPVTDMNGVTAIGSFYTVTAADIAAGVANILFNEPITLAADAYFAVVATINTSSDPLVPNSGTPVRILDDFTVEQPWYASMINVPDDASGLPTSYSNGNAFAIRLRMNSLAGVSEIENVSAISVYPNPTNANTTVAISLTNESNVTINVTDLAGKVVYTNALGTVNGAQEVNVNTESLTSGVYMVNVSVNGTVSTEKLIVRK